MKNFIQKGDIIPVTAPAGGITSGSGLLVGALFGIAATTAAEGASVELVMEGVFILPKTSAQEWTMGAKVYWDTANSQCSTANTVGPLIGVSVAVAANPSSTGRVRLNCCVAA